MIPVGNKHPHLGKIPLGGVGSIEALKSLFGQIFIAVVVYARIPVQGRGRHSLFPQHAGQTVHFRQTHRVGVHRVLGFQPRQHLELRLAGASAHLGHIDFPMAAFLLQSVVVRGQFSGKVQILPKNFLIGEGLAQHQNNVGNFVPLHGLFQCFRFQRPIGFFRLFLRIIHPHGSVAVVFRREGRVQASVMLGLIHHIIAVSTPGQFVGAQEGRTHRQHQPRQRQNEPPPLPLLLQQEDCRRHSHRRADDPRPQPRHVEMEVHPAHGLQCLVNLGHIRQKDRLQPVDQLIVIRHAQHGAQQIQSQPQADPNPHRPKMGDQQAQPQQKQIVQHRHQRFARHPIPDGLQVAPGHAFQHRQTQKGQKQRPRGLRPAFFHAITSKTSVSFFQPGHFTTSGASPQPEFSAARQRVQAALRYFLGVTPVFSRKRLMK